MKRMRNAECGMWNIGSRDLTDRRSRLALRRILNSPRNAISLVEILISMFVLLFGLMGVAAIFPVGNHYIVEGEKFDFGSNLAQNAFEELKARGMLRPEVWRYADTDLGFVSSTTETNNTEFIQPIVSADPGLFNIISIDGPGHAFVLDPMGTATAVAPNPSLPDLDIFPYDDSSGSVFTGNPWLDNSLTIPPGFRGERWPLRRLTVLDTNGLISTQVAETIFRLRDDLVTTQPEQDDRPSIQAWDLNAGIHLRRQYKGDYSWLATIVPTNGEALNGLQPSDSAHSDSLYDVSVVVFRKRDTTPSAKSERLIESEILNDSEIAIFSTSGTPDADVDAALEDIRPGGWIAVMGVNQTTGDFMLKWYRLLALDDETGDVSLNGSPPTERGRYAMLDGPAWPSSSYTDLRVVLLPGAISVVTKQLKMEE